MIQGYHRSMRLQRKHEEFFNPFSFILGYPEAAKLFDSVFHNTDMIMIPYCHGTRKKSWKKIGLFLLPKFLHLRTFLTRDFLVANGTLFLKTFFQGTFLVVTIKNYCSRINNKTQIWPKFMQKYFWTNLFFW